jgi:hypothetical protein
MTAVKITIGLKLTRRNTSGIDCRGIPLLLIPFMLSGIEMASYTEQMDLPLFLQVEHRRGG